jgi:glyoxylase-like metal-dependent hydrolase (beta-lactamase superfamily II)
MKFGKFELYPVSDGDFWLDGGSMYGAVPKVIWSKLTPVDRKNRVKLAMNCLLIRTPDAQVLVDTGMGNKFSRKLMEIYKRARGPRLLSSLARIKIKPQDIDFVINTHLHFDHCGGNTIKKDGKYIPTFPEAQYIIQQQEWYNAHNTDEKTKSSYRVGDFEPLKDAGQLNLVDGDHEVVPGVEVIVTNGHTLGHQSVMITSEGNNAFYLGDMIPTTHHLKAPYLTGFDLYPVDLLQKKKEVIHRAAAENWLLVFEHDPDMIAARLLDESGKRKLVPIAL